jgi:F0F1-type ATP synthase assembly protein I
VSGASNDGRPPMVAAMRWVQQITSIAVEMALPAFLGHLADERWGTEPWLVGVGALFGFAVAMLHLLSLAKQGGRRSVGRGRSVGRDSAVRPSSGVDKDRGKK